MELVGESIYFIMTLKEIASQIEELMKDPKNHDRTVIGDVKPGLMVSGFKIYGKFFIAIYDERQK